MPRVSIQFPRSANFGEPFRLSARPMSKLNVMVLNMFSEGILDLNGRVIKVDKVKQEELVYRPWLWRYIMYLWIANEGVDSFPSLSYEDGTYDSNSFERGVHRALDHDEDTEEITMDDLIRFINDVVIRDRGVVRNPVIENIHMQLRSKPDAIIRTFAIARDSETNELTYLPMTADEDDPTTITVRVT